MSQVAELIRECNTRLAEIEKAPAEDLERADETQLRLAAKRLEMFAEHLTGLATLIAAPELAPDAEDEAEGDGEDLQALSRNDLNQRAEALGIETPGKLKNKQAVIDAILASADTAGESETDNEEDEDSSGEE